MLKFYTCSICGNLVIKIEDGGTTPFCCGQPMSALMAASTDGAIEKHVPVMQLIDISSNEKAIRIDVGSIHHPTTQQHYIKWIALETNQGMHIHYLSPEEMPATTFILSNDEKALHAYAYCNLHGLWIS